MTRRYVFLILMVVLFSCEKSSETDDFLLKYYGDAYEDIGYSISKSNEGYVIAGQFTEIKRAVPNYISSSSKKMAVIRTDPDGNVISNPKAFGGRLTSSGARVITLDDGSILSVGFVVDSVANQKDIYVVMLNSDGVGFTEKIYKSDGNQYATDIIETSEGFLILGNTDVKREPVSEATGNAPGKKDILLLRVKNNLDLITPGQAIGYIGNDEGVGVKPDINGGYIIVGTTDRSDKPSSEQAGTNIFLFRVNTDGSTTQPRIVGGTRNETASDFEVLDDGYLIAGTIGNEGADLQGYIWKMPMDIYGLPEFGDEIDINGSQANIPYSVRAMCRYKSSSFLLAGQHGTGLSSRMLIFSVDAYGNLVEERIKITGGTGTQSVNDVISDENDNIIAIGRNSYENNSMITFLKFRF
jgi:hypothetical protein